MIPAPSHLESNRNVLPLPDQNIRPQMRHNLLPIPNIPRPPLLPILILHVILHKHPTHNRLDRARSQKPTRTCLTSKTKVHVGGADADEFVGFALGVFGPAESVKGEGIGDDVWVAAEGTGGEADVGSFGEG